MKRLLLAVLAVLFLPSYSFGQHSQSAKKYVRQGLQHFSRGDLAGAISLYDRALAIDPKFVEAYLNRGKAKRAGGDLDSAIADFEVVCELNPTLSLNNRDMAQAYLNRGYIRSNRLDLDGALLDFDRAIHFDSSDPDAYFKRGRAFLIQGNIKLAIADFDKSISLDDRNPLVYAERGLARQTAGDTDGAQKDFERGVKLNHDLRLMLDMHLLDLQIQMKEMRRRETAILKNIA